MTLAGVLSGWTGTVEQHDFLRQWARDYDWEGPVEDAEFAASHVAGTIRLDMPHASEDALDFLESCLQDSALRRGAT